MAEAPQQHRSRDGRPCAAHALLLLLPLLHCVPLWSFETDLWYIGCFNYSSPNLQENGSWSLHCPKGDFPTCSTFCRQNKYTEPICLPYGDGRGMLAVFTSSASYIYDINIGFQNTKMEIGSMFMLNISGHLSSLLERKTGVQNLKLDNLTTVTVSVQWSKQSINSFVAHVGLNGYFATFFNFTYLDPGSPLFVVHIKNIISKKECKMNIEMINKRSRPLEIKNREKEHQILSYIPDDSGQLKPIIIAFRNMYHPFHAFVLHESDLNYLWHYMDNTFTQNLTELCLMNLISANGSHEGNTNVFLTTAGQITIGLSYDASTNLIHPIKFTLESGNTLHVEMLIKGKISVRHLVFSSAHVARVYNLTIKENLDALAEISLEVSEQSAKLCATDDVMTIASINILHQPILGKEFILVAQINGQVPWNKDYVYTWTLENNVTYSSGSPLITVTCTKLGLHSVRLTATNSVTAINASTEYNVIESENVPRFTHPSNAQLEEQVQFLLKPPPIGLLLSKNERVAFHFGDNTSINLNESYFRNYGVNITHSYKKAGLYKPTLLMETTKIEYSSLLLIQQPLEHLILYGPAVQSLSFGAPTHLIYLARTKSGFNAVYRWFISGGQTNETVIGKSKLNLTIEAPCSLTVNLEAENHAGRLSATTITVVQYPIFDVSVTTQDTLIGRFTRFIVQVEPYQPYTVSIHFGDGEGIQVQSQEFAKGCFKKKYFCSVFIHLHRYNHVACYNVSVEVSNLVSTVRKRSEATIEEDLEILLLTSPIIKVGDFINATLSLKYSSGVLYLWTVYSPFTNYSLLECTLSFITNTSGIYYITASKNGNSGIHSSAKQIKVLDAINNVTVFIAAGIDHANLVENADGTYSTELIQFKALTDANANFIFDFGDETPSVHANGRMQTTGFGASVFHSYNKADHYIIKVMAFNELYNATDEIGPFYVEEAPAGLSIVMDSDTVYKDYDVKFSAKLRRGTHMSYMWNIGDQATYNNKELEINVTFSNVKVYNVTVTAWNKVGKQKAQKVVNVFPRKKSIYIYTNGTIFSTDTFINFTAKTDEPGHMMFTWQFGDRSFERTSRRSIIKRFPVPNRYDVIVNASSKLGSLTSDIHTIFVQRKVIPNRLVASSSVLVNSSVNFNCRINSGTNASYFWNFGDGIERLGNNNVTHVYTREAEYTVNVSIFNNVSSAFLTKQIFVVEEYCQPPPVKNMGPLKIQIRRYEELHLGVTFEAPILCNISQGLYYQWSFVKSTGAVIPLSPHINNKKQTITLPAFFLDYGTYTALARVQIVGNVVYSNYTVPVEIQASDPVSVIANGHHFIIDKTTVEYFTLNGTLSFDPDNPEAHLRFHWSCSAVCVFEHLCFGSSVNPLHKEDAVITFPTNLLNDRCDQFHFTLTVSNGDRRSSNAETFLSISPNTNFRTVQVMCNECKGLSINWNQKFSVQAVCPNCSDTDNITYDWKLYWINATEANTPEVPFCRLKESIGAPSAIKENVFYNGTSMTVPSVQITSTTTYPASVYAKKQVTEHLFESNDLKKNRNGNESEHMAPINDLYTELTESSMDLLDEVSTGSRDAMRHGLMIDRSDLDYKELHTYEISGFISGDGEGGRLLPNATKGQTHEDFEMHIYGDIVEGAGGSGTRTEGEIDFTYSFTDEYTAANSGDNFVDLSVTTPNVLPMVYWLKLPINRDIFSSYTTSGFSSQTIIIKPYVLKPGKMYMLNVTLKSHGYNIGMSQLYFTVNERSHKMTCQVQPKSGVEVFTIFSIFCTSGKEDLNYEFSYQVGELSRKTLYKGRDIQYYFNLPSGYPSGEYQVTVFTQITNLYGSQTQPCPVNVTVLPIVFSNTSGNQLPQTELFQESLRNLSTLVLMGNHIEIRNYVVLLTTVLNRVFTEENKMAFAFQSEIRNKLIFIVQGLSFSNKDELGDIISMLIDLFNATNQVTTESALLIINYTRSIVKRELQYTENARNIENMKKLVENIILLISSAMEVYSRWPELKTIFEDGVKCISDLMLKCIASTKETHFNISTNFLELQTTVHANVGNNIQRIGSSTFYLPKIQDVDNRRQNTSIKCYISQLKTFKNNPFFWTKLPSEVNSAFTSLSLFDCSTRRKLGAQDIVTPVTMEIDSINQNEIVSKTQFILFRDKVNFHQFYMIPKNKQSALMITVSFSKPQTRTFPVLLLIRHSKKPSPSSFTIKQIHSLEDLEHSTQIFIPTDFLRDAEYSYMALMDADYKRHPKNKYISSMINYTVDVQWTQCLYWHNKQWNSEDCSPQKGTTASAFTCICTHLGMYTTAKRQVSSHCNMEDISQFLSTMKNLVPSITVVICILLYIVLMYFGKIKEQHADQKDGFVFLQDNSPHDQQQYAIMIDVGFRSRPISTSKVHIILHGEDGVSETRELYCSDKPLFERNSRQTFIMSVPESLGPLWKIHIWHNNSGSSPSLYLSHVIVKDLLCGTSWFFYAECWLAIDEGDGKVERELTSVRNGLGFKKLFYCKFTEYLEDFHFWGSVFCQPSYSWFSLTQRITACFVLLLGYMCMDVLLIHWIEEQYTVEMGLLDISTISMTCGLKATSAVYPLVVVLSFLFRLSQKKLIKDSEDNRFKVLKGSQISTTEGHQRSTSAADTMFESNLTWQHFQYWAYDAWKKKYKRDFSASSIHFGKESRRYKNQCPSISSQISSGFEDCSSNNGDKADLKVFKNYENGSSEFSSVHSLIENSLFHGNKVLPSWCVYVAWTICATFSLLCMTIIVAFGFRFGPTKCVLWLHSVFFSLIYCIFIIQPSLILLIALMVAWHKREKTDFFLESVNKNVKYIDGEPCLTLQNLSAYSRQSSHETSNFEKILAARKRARYLRLARPPTSAQLKPAKDKLRRKTIVGKIFRELAVYIIMASMLIFIIIGKYSRNERYVNHAVKNEFTRNAKQPFDEIKTEDHWWNFCFNVLLDGLYGDKQYSEESLLNKVNPMEGKFYIIGGPIMRKLDTANYSASMSSLFSDLFYSTLQLSNGANDKPSTIKTQVKKMYHCGKIQCYEEKSAIINLGWSRTEANSTVWDMRSQLWIDRTTRALIVQFLLYNPPTNLFTTVSLLTELPVSGDILTSSHVDSVRIYRITTSMEYFIMTFELLYIGMVLIYVYLQLKTMIQRGFRSYWQEPWNWAEVSIIVLSACYFCCQIYHFILTVDKIDHLQRGFFKIFINFSLIISVEKWIRCLQGIILFLLIIKIIKLLRLFKMMAHSVAVFQHSCSSSAFTMLVGVIFIMAYSSLGHLMFSSESYSFCSVLNSVQTIFIQLLGLRGIKHIHFLQSQIKSNHISTAWFYVALFIAFTVLWTGMLKGILTFVAKYSKKVQRSKHLVTFKELVSYASRLVFSVIGRQRQKNTDNICVTGSNYYLDEFEDLIDELLFRLNAISDSLHHSLPAKSQCYTEEEGDMNHLDTSSVFSFKQTMAETKEYSLEEKLKTELVTAQCGLHCSCFDGRNLDCLARHKDLETAFSNVHYILEDVLSVPDYSEDTMDHNKQYIKTKNEHVGNCKDYLDVSQFEFASKYLPNDESAILQPVCCMNVVDLECNKTGSKRTRCISANAQNKTPRPLRRLYTTEIEHMQSSTTTLWKTSSAHGTKENLQRDGHPQQPECDIFQTSVCEGINVKGHAQNHVETVSPTTQQQLIKNAVIQMNNTAPHKTNSSIIHCSVKQCW